MDDDHPVTVPSSATKLKGKKKKKSSKDKKVKAKAKPIKVSEEEEKEEEKVEVKSTAGAGAGAGAAAPDKEKDKVLEKETSEEEERDWTSFGLHSVLLKSISDMGWAKPSPIQQRALPPALEGRDVIGLAETGSGKTAAFALPILQRLLDRPSRLAGLVLAPTRELAFGIADQFKALGSAIDLECCVIVGGVDMMTQAIALAKKPHVIVATPGRLVDHMENTKGFSLLTLKFLVMDEADRMLSLDFEEPLDKILAHIPKERSTYLFSATMTSKVAKLQRASLVRPVRVQVSSKYGTVDTLIQQYLFIPAKYKDCYLAYVVNELAGKQAICFVSTCNGAQRLMLMLQNLGFSAVALHGQMAQPKRLAALNSFKGKTKSILIATDVASRGLDIPSVDAVLNFDLPTSPKDYVHRVGRTARAGRAGRAVSFVTQYDYETYQRIEKFIGLKLPAFECEEATVLVMLERVTEAQRMAAVEQRDREARKAERSGGRRKRGGAFAADAERTGDEAAVQAINKSLKKRKQLATALKGRKNQRGAGRGPR